MDFPREELLEKYIRLYCGMSELATYESTDEWLGYTELAYIP